jgi:phenylacetate-CoA ligase
MMSVFLRRGVLKLHELATRRRILKRLDELNRTQWLGRDELLALQRDKLQRLVEYAYQYVPYYRRTFKQAGFHPDDLRKDLASLRRLPILTRVIIRENFDEMMTTEPQRRRRMSVLSTSGSTGHPLIFMQDSDFRDYVTAGIQRHLGWAGWEMGQLHAYIWGAKFDAGLRQSLRNRMIDWVWNRFQVNAFALTDEALAAFADRVQRQRPRILFGYASSLHRFAQFVRQSAYQNITIDSIFSTSEPLLPTVRQFIEETFQGKVFNRYGLNDLGDIACECQAHTGLHISPENNYVEILCGGRPAEPGEMGDIIVTNLNNWGMPFIRYSNGDTGVWYDGEDCPCGRASPMLGTVEGRTVDTFKTRDGRTVWTGFTGAAFRCLASPEIKQFQIVQRSLDRMVVRLVQNVKVPQSILDEIVRAIQTAFGDNVEVEFEFMDEIPTLPSGKHRYAVSELNKP